MRRWQPRIALVVILALTAFSVYAAWPSEPDRYLPGFIPWPEGQGINITVPTIEGSTITTTEMDRRAMKLGLDLRGGSRVVLEPSEVPEGVDLGDKLDDTVRIIERRINAFGVGETEITRQGSDRIAVQAPGIGLEDLKALIAATTLLQFCEAVEDDAGNFGVVEGGTVVYEEQSCQPKLDETGDILTDPPEASVQFVTEADLYDATNPEVNRLNDIVWTPAKGTLKGAETELTGRFLERNTYVTGDVAGRPVLVFSLNSDGANLFEQITERLVGKPLTFYLDGEPILGEDGEIIAPTVQSVISDEGQITGLSLEDANTLSKRLNTGAFPLTMRVIQEQEVDATLGEDAVKATVIAGEVALLLIMLFMMLYYRLPGVLACLALVVYTSLLLAIFKIGPIIGPVTITLAGVAAFVLSVGMAVDANILIFERMKEELRIGRGLAAAIDTGFARAWPSIRDSNISTFITCLILFWFGDQFGEALVKGFALTLAIGVALSMFSAIFVTRTFLRLTLGTPLARNLSLFVSDLPPRVVGQEPAPASGAPGEES